MKFIFKIYNNVNFFMKICYNQFCSNFDLIRCYQFKFYHFQQHNPINDAYQRPQVLSGRSHSLWAACMSAIDNCLAHNFFFFWGPGLAHNLPTTSFNSCID